MSAIIFGFDDIPDFQICSLKSKRERTETGQIIEGLLKESHMYLSSDHFNTTNTILWISNLIWDSVGRPIDPPFPLIMGFANTVTSVEVPISNSPITGQDLKTIAGAVAPESMVFLASVSQGNPLVLSIFYAAGSVIVMGLASAVSEALKRGFFRKLTKALGNPAA